MASVARVLSVNVSRGGVPKLPVAQAFVSRLGVEGDAHREDTVHGGPQRAVCLFSMEAIERLQAEGHPVEAGSVGENLTTSGVEWSTLPVGTRAQVGQDLLLEIASSTTPCDTQRHNFRDGRFSRISIDIHPSDSRMYASVLREGTVRPGDEIQVLPPAADSRAHVDALLNRIDRPAIAASQKLWGAARRAGLPIHVLDDGDIGAGACATNADMAFNHAYGMRLMPHLLPRILRHYDRAGAVGYVPHVPPVAGALPATVLGTHAVAIDDLPPAAPSRVEVAHVQGDMRTTWIETYLQRIEEPWQATWRSLLAHLLDERDVHPFLASHDDAPIGVGLLFVRRKAGWLGGAFVVPGGRGRGAQRALIAARIELARELGCEVIGSSAERGSISARNLVAAGLPRIDDHPFYRYEPRTA